MKESSILSEGAAASNFRMDMLQRHEQFHQQQEQQEQQEQQPQQPQQQQQPQQSQPHQEGGNVHNDDKSLLSSSSTAIDVDADVDASALVRDHQRPILVGYAFGPKKMSTMGMVMAEASKALSTVVTAVATTVDLPTVTTTKTTKAETRVFKTKDSIDSVDKHKNISSSSNYNNNENDHSYGNVVAHRVVPLTPTFLQEMEAKLGISPLPAADGVFRFVQRGGTAATAAAKVTGGNTVPMPSVPVPVVSSYSNSSAASFTDSTTCSTTHHQLCPIRVSFVPLDLDSPLEEQHGGKFDAILHKLTEDILCMSKMSSSSSSNYGNGNDNDSSSSSSMDRTTHTELFNCQSPISSSRSSTGTGKWSPSNNPVHPEGSDNETPSSSSSAFPFGGRKLEETQQQAVARVRRLERYKDSHPQCCLVDHPSNVKVLMSRSDIANVLSKCLVGIATTSGVPVRTPRFEIVNHTTNNNNSKYVKQTDHQQQHDKGYILSQRMEQASFDYPLIAKPLIAAGTAESHRMAVVLDQSGLEFVQTPCLLQEYANHDATLYKVYVLGDTVRVFRRPSLPNLPTTTTASGTASCHAQHPHGIVHSLSPFRGPTSNSRSPRQQLQQHSYVEFDSQRPYPKLADFGVYETAHANERTTGGKDKRHSGSWVQRPFRIQKRKRVHTATCSCSVTCLDECVIVTSDEIRPVVNVLKKAFGLELFGFDILITHSNSAKGIVGDTGSELSKERQREMLVVDVNYFPSYKEVSNFPSLLAQYLAQRAIEGRITSR